MLASVVRTIIAPALRECPRACGIVTITLIEVSPDASYATAHVSALREPERALAFLEERKAELQRKLGEIPRRKIPVLRFRIDREPERLAALDRLLRES